MHLIYILASLIFLFNLSSITFAESSSPHDSHSTTPTGLNLSQKTPQQINEEKELDKLPPEEYRLLVLGTQIYLGRFGYGVGPFTGKLDKATQDALKAYQKNVGITETGSINKETLQHLTDDNMTLQIIPFIPKFTFNDKQWDEVVSAHGTWALENLPVAEALQTSQISCHKKWNLCSVSTAKLAPGYTPTLLSYMNIYEIKSWDESTIITNPSKTGSCVSTTLHIQRKKPSITRLASFERTKSGSCAKVTPRNVRMQLADGSQIYRALKQQKIEDAQSIFRVKQKPSSKN